MGKAHWENQRAKEDWSRPPGQGGLERPDGREGYWLVRALCLVCLWGCQRCVCSSALRVCNWVLWCGVSRPRFVRVYGSPDPDFWSWIPDPSSNASTLSRHGWRRRQSSAYKTHRVDPGRLLFLGRSRRTATLQLGGPRSDPQRSCARLEHGRREWGLRRLSSLSLAVPLREPPRCGCDCGSYSRAGKVETSAGGGC